MYIKNHTKGTVLADNAMLANTFWQRLKGLLGTKAMAVGGGLVIQPCSSVHTFGMAYSIDVLFMDDENRIVKIVTAMPSARVALRNGSSYVIELPSGTVEQAFCTVGDILEWK